MKRFLIFILLFPALATIAFYAVLYILTGAVVDSFSGPAVCYLAFVGPALVLALLDWFAARTRIPGIVATTLVGYVAAALAVFWAGAIDAWVFGLVGGVAAAACSWLSGMNG